MNPCFTHIPDARQRQALQLIRAGTVPNVPNHVGKATIKRFIEKGWIESAPLDKRNTASRLPA
jgi:hypothetical protein